MSWIPKNLVVVPVDFSDESFAAVDTAIEIAREPSVVHVVHILREPHVGDPDVAWQVIDNENRKRHAEEALRARLSESKYADLQIEVDFGDAGYRIAEYAKDAEADLIVIPSHGRTGLRRMMLGSVAERVLRMSHCPVLVLRS